MNKETKPLYIITARVREKTVLHIIQKLMEDNMPDVEKITVNEIELGGLNYSIKLKK